MATITAFDVKTRFAELLDRVAKGEEIVITRHDKPVARIVPEARKSLLEVSAAMDTLNALRSRILGRGEKALSDAGTRAAISEGGR